MLPFARILEYGNTIEVPIINKMQSSTKGLYVQKDSFLYYIGLNQSGESANGSTTQVNDWYLVSTNVRTFFAYDTGVIIIRNDSTVWSSGRTSWFPSNSITNVLTNRTSWFSTAVNIDDIRDINFCTNGTVFVVMNNNDLYGASSLSRGTLGNGSTGIVNTLTFLKSGVKSAYAALNDSYHLTIDNIFFSTGWNNTGVQGTGNTTQVNTWRQISTGVLAYTASHLSVIYYNGSTYNVCGQAPNFSGASRTTYAAVSTTVLPAETPRYLLAPRSSTTNPTTLVVGTSYVKGVGSLLPLGVNSSSSSTSAVNVTLPVTLIDDISLSWYNTFILSNGEIWGTGDPAAIPGATGNVLTFKKINLPT
jgi:hypothetical protein